MTTQEISPKEKQELTEKEPTHTGRYYVPEVDIYEDETALRMWADLPGVDQQHVDVELRDDELTIHAQVSLSDYEGLSPLSSEYNVGHYLRRFNLVDAASFDADQITAKMTNGVLELTLPKAERAKRRRIPITTS
jgi:HSP20 family protein